MKRKALGKGLSSLLPRGTATPVAPKVEEAATGRESFTEIDIDRIRPNSRQPRQHFDTDALDGLSSSLKNQGVLQPVVVRRLPSGEFELVVGERRWRAAQRAGLHRIPAIIREVADGQLLETALLENLQRENLNPIEEAQAYRSILEESRLSQEQLAARVGKQRATVSNSLRLLGLPPAVQDQVRTGVLSMGHARALLGLPTTSEQIRIADRAVREKLSVREVELLVSRSGRDGIAVETRKRTRRDPNVEAAERTLESAMGTKVRIVQTGKGGRIEVFFYSPEDLERAYQLMLETSRQVRKQQADRKVGNNSARPTEK
jgi:ParB family chromosome partitioning protein